MNDLLRPLGWPPAFRHAGRHLCHPSREEIRDLYYKVYKLRRLQRSLLYGPEWAGELMRDVVSSLKNCLRQKEDMLPRGQAESEFADTHPMQNRTPWGR